MAPAGMTIATASTSFHDRAFRNPCAPAFAVETTPLCSSINGLTHLLFELRNKLRSRYGTINGLLSQDSLSQSPTDCFLRPAIGSGTRAISPLATKVSSPRPQLG